MKTELERLKGTIEKQIGRRIDTRERHTDLAFARSVFCKIAREELTEFYSLSKVGKAIDRDHSTVMHSIKTVFDYAMQDKRFRELYEDIVDTIKEERPVESLEASKSIRERLNESEEENKMLRHKLSLLLNHNTTLENMIEGLSEEDIQEVYNKLDVFVKVTRQVKGYK